MKRRKVYIRILKQANKVAWITIFYLIISINQFLSGYLTVLQFNCDLSGLNVWTYIGGTMVTGLTAGLLGGSVIVFFWLAWLRSMSYGKSLLNIFWTYTSVYLIVSLISSAFFYSTQLEVSVFHTEVWNRIGRDLITFSQIQNYLFWLFIVIATLIALLVNDKYGPGVFVSFLLGKYFRPQREERIFMFLDLRGSTSIAEQLGESRYFNFLKDAYRDATPGILNTKGEIYQYVGDEIVVSWKRELGTENANALRCYFNIKQRISDKASYYKKNYEGNVPEFKAGLHYGFVMAGEIGIVKRDIAYSGDVLNTTSRIQAKCNELQVNILLSKHLLDTFGSLPDLFHPTVVGKIALRGKQQSLMLYTV